MVLVPADRRQLVIRVLGFFQGILQRVTRAAVLALLVGQGLSAPVDAQGRPLSLDELDAVSAGSLNAITIARANAFGGLEARAVTETNTVIGSQEIQEVDMRAVSNDLVLAVETATRRVSFALAQARAEAEGNAPDAFCDARITGLPAGATLLSEKITRQNPGSAFCNCASFGFSVQGD